ncbi:unnamed protein product [Sympodiomycopsis kandeliae]
MQFEQHTRPRLPSSRRSSQKVSSTQASIDTSSAQQAMPRPPLAPASRQNTESSFDPHPSSPQDEYEHDLDLDLPSHLTAALGAARHRQPRLVHDLFSGSASKADGVVSAQSSDSKTLHRKWSSLAEEASLDGPHDRPSALASPSHVTADALSPSMDREYIGTLGREELELLLFEANEVIRDRERDLGIAAAIGQALLQKNISLRNKHQGVMSRLASASDLQQLSDDHDDHEDDEPAPLYSPPTNDDHSQGDGSVAFFDGDATTPMPESWPTPSASSSRQEDGYFPAPSSHASRESSSAGGAQLPASSSSYADFGFPGMQPRMSGLISSAPQSPGGLSMASSSNNINDGQSHAPSSRKSRLRHHRSTSLQPSETQKQLSFLSTQNEALLAQLSELQEEAEEAKRQGGKKLRKLNKEIEGLQAELGAATERNVQLEQDAGSNAPPVSASPFKPSLSRTGKAQGGEDSASASPLKANLRSRKISLGSNRLSMTGLASSEISISGGIDAILASAEQEYTSEQRSVIVKLLSKVRELEKMNSVLEEDRKEREDRLGEALERGVRISDEYDAVLQAHEHDASGQTFQAAGNHHDRDDDDDTANVQDTTSGPSTKASPARSNTSATSSPLTRRRRAIGNRVQVEGRRTMRSAMRQHRRSQLSPTSFTDPFHSSEDEEQHMPGGMSTSSTLDSLLSASTVDSMASSTKSQGDKRKPRRKGSALALNRPRILITPSMEDLATRRKEQADGWQDENSSQAAETEVHESEVSGTNRPANPRQNSLDPSDAHWIAELAEQRLAYERQQQQEELQWLQQQADHEQYLGNGIGPHGLSMGRSYSRRRRSSFGSDAGHDALQIRGQTLQGELESSCYDQTDDMRLEELGSSMRRPALRTRASFGSITSDIANLQWSVRGGEEGREDRNHDVLAITDGQDGDEAGDVTPRSLAIGLPSHDVVDLTLMRRGTDGQHSDDESCLLSRGALRDLNEPREEQYSLLERTNRDAAVQWADDDDYGRPIKESDARKMGLVMSSHLSAERTKTIRGSRSRSGLAAGVNLLSWAIGGRSKSQSKQVPQQSRAALAIQDSEQLESDRRREEHLQRKYNLAMKNRGLRTRRHDVYGEVPDNNDDESHDAEQELRRWSLSSPVKQGSKRASLFVAHHEERKEEESEKEDEPFEVLPASSLQPTSSYWPLDRRSRYRPKVVRQRVHQQGVEAVNEITAWASLVFVLIIAFFVSASRGEMNPKRILGSSSSSTNANRHTRQRKESSTRSREVQDKAQASSSISTGVRRAGSEMKDAQLSPASSRSSRSSSSRRSHHPQ